MKNVKTYIHIKKDDREFIAKAFGVGNKTIHNALHYDDERGGSELAKRIRRLALERGGIKMVEVPESEVLFDSDGYMRQYMQGGVLLEFNLEEGDCVVFKKGEEVRRFVDVFVRDVPFIQEWAEGLACGAGVAAAQQQPTQHKAVSDDKEQCKTAPAREARVATVAR